MIEFSSQNKYLIKECTSKKFWINLVITKENKRAGDINYVFCDDDFLHKINVDYLNHDTYTDVISFDYSINDLINGEIYISTERVFENAKTLGVSEEDELDRVIIHGILHFCGHGDKTEEERVKMRALEDIYLKERV